MNGEMKLAPALAASSAWLGEKQRVTLVRMPSWVQVRTAFRDKPTLLYDNCTTQIYLGASSIETAERLSRSLGEWTQVLEAPPSAGMIVITAQSGGSIRESFSMAKAYTEARQHHGESELLDEVASTKPEVDRTRTGSREELKEHNLGNLRDAVAVLEAKAEPGEVEEYKRFILGLAERVAEAHREGFMGLSGERVSDAERAAVEEIAATLGISAEPV